MFRKIFANAKIVNAKVVTEIKGKYIQCRLVRGNTHKVAWIDANKAVAGKTDGVWTVEKVYGNTVIDKLENVRKSIKYHRKRTGDAERKTQ